MIFFTRTVAVLAVRGAIKPSCRTETFSSNARRYHGRWIDSVWKSRSYAGFEIKPHQPIHFLIMKAQ